VVTLLPAEKGEGLIAKKCTVGALRIVIKKRFAPRANGLEVGGGVDLVTLAVLGAPLADDFDSLSSVTFADRRRNRSGLNPDTILQPRGVLNQSWIFSYAVEVIVGKWVRFAYDFSRGEYDPTRGP